MVANGDQPGLDGARRTSALADVEPTGSVRLAFAIPATVASIPDATSAILGTMGRAPDDVLASAALSEALLNAVVHGALGIPGGAAPRDVSELQAAIRAAEEKADPRIRIAIEVRRSGSDYNVTIKDPGAGFDWRATLARDDATADLMEEGGRGLLIIRAACRALAYNAMGNEVTLTFDGSGEEPRNSP